MALRILHVTRTPLTVRTFLLPLVAEHARRGHRVELAFGEGPAEDLDVPIHRYRIRRSARPWHLAQAVGDLRRILVQGRFDRVVAHMVLVGLVTRLAQAQAGRSGRLVYASHGLACYPMSPIWNRWGALALERTCSRWTDAMIVLNRYDAAKARNHRLTSDPDQVHHLLTVGIPYGTIVSRATGLDRTAYRRSLGLPIDRPLVCYAGRFIRAKGVLLAVEVARRILDAGIQVHFVIAGTGPLDSAVRLAASSPGLQSHVTLVGWHNDVVGLVAASDVLLLPTLYEGSPIVVQEAMAAGTPVVASDVPGPQDLIRSGLDGLLVRPGDVRGFCEALTGLLADPGRRYALGRTGQVKAAEFDSEIWAPRWADAIEGNASGGPC